MFLFVCWTGSKSGLWGPKVGQSASTPICPEGQRHTNWWAPIFHPLRDAIFPTRVRENGLFKEKPSTKAAFPFSRGKNRISQGVENRGSPISVPLALRVFTHLNPFRDIGKNPFFPHFNGGWKLFAEKGPEAVPTQHRLSGKFWGTFLQTSIHSLENQQSPRDLFAAVAGAELRQPCITHRLSMCHCDLNKGFLQSEVWGEVCTLDGAVRGEVFFLRSLGRSLRACFAGTFRAKRVQLKLQPKVPWLCAAKMPSDTKLLLTKKLFRNN